MALMCHGQAGRLDHIAARLAETRTMRGVYVGGCCCCCYCLWLLLLLLWRLLLLHLLLLPLLPLLPLLLLAVADAVGSAAVAAVAFATGSRTLSPLTSPLRDVPLASQWTPRPNSHVPAPPV
jgi:hypothetical protein|mmetsp:Transcript_72293/g.121345  ORF Transcript_72293/g.121345 Transcript_72293/m.121345 type:complete len:122 (+) Transcript_72293:279-644(+)